jgi:hypothetical protein
VRTHRLYVAAIALLAVGCGSSSAARTAPSTSATPAPSSTSTSVTMARTPPPWPAPVIHGGADYIRAAGLPLLEKEALEVHFHAHLDVVVDGTPVPVPAYIGFAVVAQGKANVTTVHTHDAAGIVHIEAPGRATYTLGQFFTEWGVRFDQQCLGSLCAGGDKELAVFLNGQRYTGDPRPLPFNPHDEIAVEFGDKGKLPPAASSYRFPHGL